MLFFISYFLVYFKFHHTFAKNKEEKMMTHFLVHPMAISGAFKFRGACNAVFSLNDEDASKGVVTHSRFAMCSNS